MLPLLLGMLHTPVLGADLHNTYLVGMRSEARTMPAPTLQREPPVASEGELSPFATVTSELGRNQLLLSYTPRLLFPELPARGRQPNVLHRGRLGYTYGAGPGRTFVLAEDATYGVNDFYSLTASPRERSPLDPVPAAQALPYAQSTTTASYDHALSQRTRVQTAASYSVGGGWGAEAQRILPFMSTLRGTAGAAHAVAPRDTLSSTLDGSETRLSTGARATLVQLSALWQRQLDRQTEGRLGLGLAASRAHSTPTSPPDHEGQPTGVVGIVHRVTGRSQRLELSAGVQTAPYVHRLTGAVVHRVEGEAGALWGPHPEWSFTLRGRTASALFAPVESRESYSQVDLGAAWQFARYSQIDAGVRALWQRQTNLPEGSLLLWAAYAAVTFGKVGVF